MKPSFDQASAQRSISESALHPKGKAFIFFLLVFVLMGSGMFYAFFIRPLLNIASAKNWPAVPCVVISSGVKSHSGSHGSTTYSVNILYRYEFNGRQFNANRYDFMGGSSSGSSGKYAIVARYPPGHRTICYVNPADPIQAVLERGFTPAMWVGLVPLLFVLFGVAGIVGVWRGYRVNSTATAPGPNRGLGAIRMEVISRPADAAAAGPLVLKPNVSPWGKLIGVLFFALFWNGIVSVFVVNIIKHWRAGPVEWFLAVFMVPFVLIGLGMIGAVVYFFFALFNPRPHLRISPAAVPLGGTFRVGWEINGRTDVLRRLRIRLQGREEATYQNGKNTSTATNVFADIEIADVTLAQAMRSGDSTVTVPGQVMHSFTGRHNKIVWVIRIHGEIAHWPDMSEEFPVTILPGGTSRAKIDEQPTELSYERA